MIIKRLKRMVRLSMHYTELYLRDHWLKWRLRRHWTAHLRAAPVAAPATATPLIVSLTSYPARFATLHWTLKSLLLQSYAERKVVLWIAHQDMARLPADVLALQAHGLEIRACDDTRSFKKLLPAMQHFPGATIVTADDDLFYWPDWLRQLVDAAKASDGKEIVAHRIHRIRHTADGLPLPYSQWEIESQNTEASALNFPTGNGGVLYPPDILADGAQDRAAYTSLCPTADDIWFYWMGRLNGVRYRRVPGSHFLHDWQGSQLSALSIDNVGADRNDQQIARMIARYGYVNAAVAGAL